MKQNYTEGAWTPCGNKRHPGEVTVREGCGFSLGMRVGERIKTPGEGGGPETRQGSVMVAGALGGTGRGRDRDSVRQSRGHAGHVASLSLRGATSTPWDGLARAKAWLSPYKLMILSKLTCVSVPRL